MACVRVSAIVPSWNGADVLGPCLARLAAQEVTGGLETIVVDDASTDGTPEVLRRHAEHIRVIRNERNAGFAAANNQAATRARGEILFFLNSDTELLGRDAVERLARAFDDPGVGLAGPRLVNPDGTLQPSCGAHPSVIRALLVMSGVHRMLPDRLLPRVNPERWSHDRARDVDWVKGAAVAVRADVFRGVGGFWPALYAEEQDLAFRVRQRGLRVRFEAAPRVMHVGNHSFGQLLSRAERAERVARAELRFLRTHYRPLRRTTIRLIVWTGFTARAVAHGMLRRGEPAAVYRAMARVYGFGRPPQQPAASAVDGHA